jgi:small subunit ribosomal protein S17
MTETAKVIRSLSGRVVSDKMDKTITVLVERKVKHPLIGKVVVKSNKFHAHDENNECKEGDLVTITESRPMSKTKTWVVSKVVKA